MYLNDFRVESILEVIEKIKANDKSDLIYHIHIDDKDKGKTACLHYVSYFHRLEAYSFNPLEDSLYPNRSVTALLAPKETFIKKIVPCGDYDKMFNN